MFGFSDLYIKINNETAHVRCYLIIYLIVYHQAIVHY